MPVFRGAVVLQANGNQFQNTFWCNDQGGFGTAGTADHIRDNYIANVLPHLSASTAVIEVRVSDPIAKAAAAGVSIPADVSVGGAGATLAPTEVAIACTAYSAIYGRRGRGRVFIAGLSIDSLAGDVADPTFLTELQAGMEAFRAATVTAGYDWCVVHGNDHSADQVVRVVCQPTLRSQRRRQLGRSITGMHRRAFWRTHTP